MHMEEWYSDILYFVCSMPLACLGERDGDITVTHKPRVMHVHQCMERFLTFVSEGGNWGGGGGAQGPKIEGNR